MTLSTTEPGHLSQRQLEATLWSAANALRGPVDPVDYKGYVFPVMFFKWISDSWDREQAQAIEDFRDALTEEIEADYHTFVIPDGCHWADVIGTAYQTGVKLDNAMQRIQHGNPEEKGEDESGAEGLDLLRTPASVP